MLVFVSVQNGQCIFQQNEYSMRMIRRANAQSMHGANFMIRSVFNHNCIEYSKCWSNSYSWSYFWSKSWDKSVIYNVFHSRMNGRYP